MIFIVDSIWPICSFIKILASEISFFINTSEPILISTSLLSFNCDSINRPEPSGTKIFSPVFVFWISSRFSLNKLKVKDCFSNSKICSFTWFIFCSRNFSSRYFSCISAWFFIVFSFFCGLFIFLFFFLWFYFSYLNFF